MAGFGIRAYTAAGAVIFLGAAVLVAPASASGVEAADKQPVLTGDYTDTQWNLLSTSLEAVHAAGHKGTGVTIAILDSNYDGTHPEIAPNVVEAFVVKGKTVNQVDAADMNEAETHGTHVAGIAAGVDDGEGMTGVAPEASLILGAVIGDDMHPDVWPSIIAGLDHVAGRADVINISLGLPSVFIPEELQEKLCASVGRATEAGSVVVIAAGNNGGRGNPPMLPAGCETAITVTALDPDLSLANFSSFDSYVSLAAPGRDILGPLARAGLKGTPYAVEPRPLIPLSGTSMASPFVAGVAALVLEQFPGLTPEEVRLRLTDTAKDLGPLGFDPDFGYGAVNPAAAVGLSDLPAPMPTAFPSDINFGIKDDDGGRFVAARWSPPGAGGEILGYTISILGYGQDDSWDVGPREVRDLRASDLKAGWISLTVHTSEGSFTAPYAPLGTGGGNFEPIFSDVSARWVDGNRLRIDWALTEALSVDQTFQVLVLFSAPAGFEAMRVIDIDPRGRVSGRRTIDIAERGLEAQVRKGLRQYAAGGTTEVLACSAFGSCTDTQAPARLPLTMSLTPTGRTSGTVALRLSSVAFDQCPMRSGMRNCQGVVARVEMAGQTYSARFNARGDAFLPVTRAPSSAVNRADISFPGLDVGGPYRLQVVTEMTN